MVQVGCGRKLKAKWNGKNVYSALELESIAVLTVMEQAESDWIRIYKKI